MDPQATLLVVDDIAENRDMLSRRLKRRGYAVEVSADGPSALETVAAGGIDLVLLDIMMPDMDGMEVLRRLRQGHDQADLPVIMVTAKTDSEDVVRALDLGANDYVTKPIDFNVVLARVQKELRTTSAFRLRDGTGGAEQAEVVEAKRTEIGIGTVLAGRYRLGERIGSGNFGTVYSGRHLELDLPVAVKILQAQLGQSEETLARFRAEGRAACMVQHPNAVTVFDFGITPDGIAYMVMELLDGHSLGAELKHKGPMGLGRLGWVVPQVCSVLQSAHQHGIVHRDIKPDNIFLHRDRSLVIIKVVDFGIAKLVGERVAQEQLTADGFILGTPAFMAPERLRNEIYDGRSDVYSLGVSLYQLASGQLPFKPKQGDPMALLMMHLNDEPPRLASLCPSLPPDVAEIIDGCLAKDPERRPGLGLMAEVFNHYGEPDKDLSGVRTHIEIDAPTHKLATPAPPGSPVQASSVRAQPPQRRSVAGGEISDQLPTREMEIREPGLLQRLWLRLRGANGSDT